MASSRLVAGRNRTLYHLFYSEPALLMPVVTQIGRTDVRTKLTSDVSEKELRIN